MSLEKFDEIRRLSTEIEVGMGSSPSEIEQAQLKLGVRFSPSYIRFLARYGWAEIKHAYVYGLGGDVPEYLSVVNNTIAERQDVEPPLAKHLIPLMNDGAGNHYCLDSERSTDGEMPVVFWDHEAPAGAHQIPEEVSPSFGDWLYEKSKFLID